MYFSLRETKKCAVFSSHRELEFWNRAFFVRFDAWHVLSMQLVSLKHTGLFVPRHIFSCSHVYSRSSSLLDPIIQNRSLIVNLMFFIWVNNIKCYCISAVFRRTACFILPLYFTSHVITVIVIFLSNILCHHLCCGEWCGWRLRYITDKSKETYNAHFGLLVGCTCFNAPKDAFFPPSETICFGPCLLKPKYPACSDWSARTCLTQHH